MEANESEKKRKKYDSPEVRELGKLEELTWNGSTFDVGTYDRTSGFDVGTY